MIVKMTMREICHSKEIFTNQNNKGIVQRLPKVPGAFGKNPVPK
jgi:hypothetical protein